MTIDLPALIAYKNDHPLLRNLPQSGSSDYYDWEYFNQLEYHIPKLQKDASTIVVSTVADEARIYAGDFYGYLKRYHATIPYSQYWVTLRVNGMMSPLDFSEKYKTLMLVTSESAMQSVVYNKRVVNKSPF